MSGQERLDHRPLDALSSAVDQPHLPEAVLERLTQILVHHRGDVAGREGVEVEGILDREDDRLVGGLSERP